MKVRKRKKKSAFSLMGWPKINFHPKTGRRVTNCVMNPVTGAVYSNTSVGYRQAISDFNKGKY